MADASSPNKYAPLTPALVRALTDKVYEKRKASALEVEKMVRDMLKQNRTSEIERLISVMEELTATLNGNVRKGGLMLAAAIAIGLGKNYTNFSDRLLTAALTCFSDADSRVRYFACESLYNIIKIGRAAALTHFEQLFDALWKLSSDAEQTVRSGGELLDRLLKEIVRSTADAQLDELILLIRERIYSSNTSNRRFIISWLHAVLKMPNFSVRSFVPEVIDGLFRMLDDSTPAVHDTTVTVLSELLHCLDPNEGGDAVASNSIINILVVQTQSTPATREIALLWLNQLVVYYGARTLENLAGLLTAALPWLAVERLKAAELNQRLQELVETSASQAKAETSRGEAEESTAAAAEAPALDYDAIVDVLLTQLSADATETRVAALQWVRRLHAAAPTAMFAHLERLFTRLLELLQDSADDVLIADIALITDICAANGHTVDVASFGLAAAVREELGSVSPYLVKFCLSLLELFRADAKLVDDRGVQIVRQLCLLLEPADVYRALAVLTTATVHEARFRSRLVAMLCRILLTASELFRLRVLLKAPEENGVNSLFVCLYKCWCYQPICLLSLCLLSQKYEHAVDLTMRFSELDLTVELLTEIDRLIQLIESPILASLRMDLLSARHQRPLASVLSALLMLLPQTDAFHTLHKRLQVVPHIQCIDRPSPHEASSASSLDFAALLRYFDAVTEERKASVRKRHLEHLKTIA